MSQIILAPEGQNVRRIHVDGLPLSEVLFAELGYLPEASQVTIDAATVRGDLDTVDFPDMALIQVTSQATASKGHTGASA
jgi:hypothetical protein